MGLFKGCNCLRGLLLGALLQLACLPLVFADSSPETGNTNRNDAKAGSELADSGTQHNHTDRDDCKVTQRDKNKHRRAKTNCSDHNRKKLHDNTHNNNGDDTIAIAQGDGIAVVSTGIQTGNRIAGIDSGNGNDTITNNGEITVTLTQNLDEVPAAEVQDKVDNRHRRNDARHNHTAGNTGASTHADMTTTPSQAAGLSGGNGNDVITNNGTLTVTKTANSDVTQGTSGDTAMGVTGDAGNDTLVNNGDLVSTDTSTFPLIANTAATGMAGGTGNDGITNSAGITTTADATAIVVSPLGFAYAQSSANAVSIEGGEDNDTLTNTDSGTINTTANAHSISVDVSGSTLLTGGAIGVATSIVDSEATATGMQGGNGEDSLINDGTLNTTAMADSFTSNISIAINGVSGAADTFWNGGTSATARSTGMDSGAGDDSLLHNSSTLNATALANTHSTAASVAAKGLAVANAASTATAEAFGMQGGDGNEQVAGDDFAIINDGDVTVLASAYAQGEQVSVVGEGVAASISSRWDQGTTADANAIGIDGGAGNDDIQNNGTLDIDANAQTFATSIGINLSTAESSFSNALRGNVYTDLSTNAYARATGIDGGDGNDVIENNGSILVDAYARPIASELNFGLKGGTVPGLGSVIGFLLGKGGAESSASAVGINGGAGIESIENNSEISVNATAQLPSLGVSLRQANGTSVGLSSKSTAEAMGINAGAGNDVIDNHGTIDANATANARSLGVGVTGKGLLGSVSSNSVASSKAVGIDAGDGDDTITNTVTVNAIAWADTEAGDVNVNLDSGAKAGASSTLQSSSTAIGIEADGVDTRSSKILEVNGVVINEEQNGDSDVTQTQFQYQDNDLENDTGSVNYAIERNTQTVSGDDTITNQGLVNATSTAIATAADVSVIMTGASVADTTSNATAESVGIHAGGGDDSVTNLGVITSNAISNADALSVAVTPKTGVANTWAGGANANATAVGIDGDGGRETRHRLAVDLLSEQPGEEMIGLSIENSWREQSGDDVITNYALIGATATAGTASADVGVGAKGAAFTDASSLSQADATAIDSGAGNDSIYNSGILLSAATAGTAAASIPVTVEAGAAISLGGPEAIANVVGIDADGDATNVSQATTVSASFESVDVNNEILVENDSGYDTVTNLGDVSAIASAVTLEADVPVEVKGVGISITNAQATANAVVIDLGGGNDNLFSSGNLNAVATATANAVNIPVTASAGASLVMGGPEAEATVVGVDADGDAHNFSARTDLTAGLDGFSFLNEIRFENDSGDDTVTNQGDITAVATAIISELDAPVAMQGVGVGVTSGNAASKATAIDLGGGNDTLTNSGQLTSVATSTAFTANIPITAGSGASLAVTGFSLDLCGGEANANAVGIDADGDACNFASSTEISMDQDGASYAQEILFQNDSGDDTVTNYGDVTAVASALTTELDVPVVMQGVAFADSSSEAIADSTAIDLGGGSDTLTNTGKLNSVATATTAAANIPINGGSGVAIGWGGPEATATAVGIDADGDAKNFSAGVSINADQNGVAYEHEVLLQNDSGNDTVTNQGDIVAVATAVTGEMDVPVAMQGVAVGYTASKATSSAIAIDLGGGDDTLDNSGALSAVATATSGAINVPVNAGSGLSLAIGKPESSASAVGLDADGDVTGTNFTTRTRIAASDTGASYDYEFLLENDSGDDAVTNTGDIAAVATTITPALGVAVSTTGIPLALMSAQTTAHARAIDLGGGNDTLTNGSSDPEVTTGKLTAVSTATAAALRFSASSTGAAMSLGGASAEATSIGIDADGDAQNFAARTSLAASEDGVSYHKEIQLHNDSGNDSVTNYREINAVATGVASGAKATAHGIDLGGGADELFNLEKINAVSTATAVAADIKGAVGGAKGSVTGLATAAAALILGGPEAEAKAVGIDADGDASNFTATTEINASAAGVSYLDQLSLLNDSGDDFVTSHAPITAVATAATLELDVPVFASGVTVGVTSARARSNARAVDLGGGHDTLISSNNLTAVASSAAVAANIPITGGTGGAIALGGPQAEATAVGIDADGDGVNISHRTSIDIPLDEYATFSDQATIENDSGNDNVTSLGNVTAVATAITPEADIEVAMAGVTAGITEAKATSRATAVDLGAGNDSFMTNGALTAVATSTAMAANIPVTGGTGGAIALGGPQSDATAVGLDADGDGKNFSTQTVIETMAQGVSFNYENRIENDSGNDTVTTFGDVNAVATSLTPELDVPVTMAGVTAAQSAAKAKTTAVDIDLGGGDDTLTATGKLNAVASSAAGSANAPVSAGTGGAIAIGGPQAEAKAIGIDADGDGVNFMTGTSIEVSLDGASFSQELRIENDSGDDEVTNEGDVTSVATSVTAELDIPVTMAGITFAETASRATTQTAAIDLGGGNDTLTNKGNLSSVSTSTAFTANIAVSAGTGGAIGLGGPKASASAVGIDADGDGVNFSTRTDIDISPEDTAYSYETRIENDSGNDWLSSEGNVTAVATAITTEADAPLTMAGVAAAETASRSNAEAAAIDLGGGNDYLKNNGNLTAVSSAAAASANIAVAAGTGGAITFGGPEAEASAVGIDADGEGVNFSHTISLDPTLSTDPMLNSVAYRDEILLQNDSGNDTVLHEGDVTAVATAITLERDTPVAVTGAAFGESAAKANSRAAAIDLGGDSDSLTSAGNLTAVATSTAFAANVAVTTAGAAATFGGTETNAIAVGIDADGEGENFALRTAVDASLEEVTFSHEQIFASESGNDSVTNKGDVTAVATAISPELAVPVSVAGVAAAINNAEATADATAIDTGDGNDEINNEGKLNAWAMANADVLNISAAPAGVALAANAIWDRGATADATAAGIDTDGAGRSQSKTMDLSVNKDGLNMAFADIDAAASGNDKVVNKGDINAVATAIVPSIGVSFNASAGLAATVATASSNAKSSAIITGDGDDEIDNSGKLVSVATSNADTVNIAVTPAGVALAADAVWDGGTTAEATAHGISSDGDTTDTIKQANIHASTDSVGISYNTSIDYASGDDLVTNTGDITSVANAVAPSVGVSVAVAGVAGVVSTATADAKASAIDTGPGDDIVENTGDLAAVSTSAAAAVSASVTPAGLAVAAGDVLWDNVGEAIEATDWDTVIDLVTEGDWQGVWDEIGTIVDEALWDGGVSAISNAVGVNTDGPDHKSTDVNLTVDADGVDFDYQHELVQADGDDVVTNHGDITSVATAISPSVSAGVSVWGVGVAVSTAEAEADARGINTGGGEDKIENHGDLTATSVATAESLNVSFAVGGVAVSSDAVWDSGTTAHASSDGINAGEGDDVIDNFGMLDANAVSVAPSASVPIGIFGVAAALSDAMATADAAGIDAGAGNDKVTNQGNITSSSVANADAVSIAVNIFGVAGAANAVWDGGVTAETSAFGIDTGDGNDRIKNTATVEANSTAVSVSANIPFTVGGVAGAVSTSTASADAAAIDSGPGKDKIYNHGALTANADSTAVAATGSIGVFGVAVATDAAWDGGTHSSAEAYGINAGDDRDYVTNTASIDAHSIARANSDQVSVTAIGVAGSIATSTSTTESHAIAGGEGDDTIDNSGEITASADARATSVAVDVSGIGAAVAADAFWDGGTGATATGFGISGDEGNDTIWNRGIVNAGQQDNQVIADSDSVGVAATLGPISAATSSSTATTHATAIAGGNGIDHIYHFGDANVYTTADAGGVGVTVLATGVSLADSFVDNVTTADANGVGLSGGIGEDTILGFADSTINVNAMAKTKKTDVALAITGGFANADASTHAISHATGISGGSTDPEDEDVIDGDDTIDVAGVLTATATSESLSRNLTFTGLGAGDPDATSTADTTATGISGGEGNDTINSRNSVTVDATATATGQSLGITITGANFDNASTASTATATGLDGGLGEDTINNVGSLTVTGNSTANAKSIGITGLIFAAAEADATATSTATGVSGGDAINTVINRDTGVMNVTANATSNANGVGINIIGKSSAEAVSTPTANAYGLTGGSARDIVDNAGSVTVNSNAVSNVNGTSFNIIGGNVNRVGNVTASNATGFEGFDGIDDLYNSGTLTVNAGSNLTSSASSWTFAGRSANEGSGDLTVTTRAMGLSGGNDVDHLQNTGTITVDGQSILNLTGNSNAIFGGANAGVTLSADTFATGLDGGDGNDLLKNFADVNVSADADLTATSVAIAFTGPTNTGVNLTANANALGLEGGLGADRIFNYGNLQVLSTAGIDATGRVESTLGSANVKTTVTAEARATAISAGDDDDRVINSDTIHSSATASPQANSRANAGGLFTDGVTRATTNIATLSSGVDLGEGVNRFINKDTGIVTVTNGGIATATAFINTDGDWLDDLGIDIDAASQAKANITSNLANAVLAGEGDNKVENHGTLNVDINGYATSSATAKAVSLANGDGTSKSDAIANNAEGAGIKVGGGANKIINTSQIIVDVSPWANASSTSSADGINIINSAISSATSNVSVDNARAFGILSGDGNNFVLNQGDITVTSAPRANYARSWADYGDEIFAIDSVAASIATANNAQAMGIRAGDGENFIWNKGNISVISSPFAKADATAKGRGFDGDADARATAQANDALAIGIKTGNGNNTVINEGEINVTASPAVQAIALADPGEGTVAEQTEAVTKRVCDKWSWITIFRWGCSVFRDVVVTVTENVSNPGEAIQIASESALNAQAIGIQTGSGDDTITNKGSIITSVDGGTGVGIDSGAGIDAVILDDGSLVVGSIQLGDDNDTLQLQGTPMVTGEIVSGAGVDTLLFDGEGSFANPLNGFEQARKQGPGTYHLPSLTTVQRLELSEGTLQIDSDYTMASDSSMQAMVYGDGSHGELVLAGTATLDGELVVQKEKQPYLDGTRYQIISASTVDGNFASETVPVATPLLTFELQQDVDSVNVITETNPITSVADTPAEMSIASILDSMTDSAGGEMSNVIAEFQELAAGDYDQAFASLNPICFDNSRLIKKSMRGFNLGAQNRLASHRARKKHHKGYRRHGFLAGTDPLYFSTPSFDSEVIAPLGSDDSSRRAIENNTWLVGFGGGNSGETGKNRYNDYDYTVNGLAMGFDHDITPQLTMGMSYGYSISELAQTNIRGFSNTNSHLTNFYSSYLLTPDTYIDTIISFGRNAHENSRAIVVGEFQEDTASHYDSKMFSTNLILGKAFYAGDWAMEVNGALQYLSVDEGAFQEIGAGGIQLKVNGRQYEEVTGELGWRAGYGMPSRFGFFNMQVSASWLYDLVQNDQGLTASFVDVAGSSFTLPSSQIAREGIRLGAALTFAGKNDLNLTARISSEQRSDYRDTNAWIQAQMRF